MADSGPGHLIGYSSPLWGVGFRHWVGGVIAEMRRKSPVQQWVDSIPKSDQQEDKNKEASDPLEDQPQKAEVKPENLKKTALRRDVSFQSNEECDLPDPSEEIVDSIDKSLSVRRSKGVLVRDRSTNSEGNTPRHRHPFFRDSSVQSESAGSRCSSVESLLESRKVDAEAVLRGVGFGPSPSRQQLARIPDRFLKPSKVKGVDTEKFIKDEQKSMKMHECGVFGYRGLTGHPHVPPSTIVAKIIERISSCDELPDTGCYIETVHRSDIDNIY